MVFSGCWPFMPYHAYPSSTVTQASFLVYFNFSYYSLCAIIGQISIWVHHKFVKLCLHSQIEKNALDTIGIRFLHICSEKKIASIAIIEHIIWRKDWHVFSLPDGVNGPISYWMSRDGEQMVNWGGVQTGVAGCACHLTNCEYEHL